jgi:hypothetical protein
MMMINKRHITTYNSIIQKLNNQKELQKHTDKTTKTHKNQQQASQNVYQNHQYE